MPGQSESPRWSRQHLVLLLAISLELAVFGAIGTRFWTAENGFEIARLSVEVGLLAVALTPIIISGGIDLSVGSLVGLCAITFGKLWRDGIGPVGPLPLVVAALLTALLGGLAGLLNATLITRWRLPALIVTLGSFSLFRGLAEGVTGGVENYTSFPVAFLFLGQGYWLGFLPPQLPLFVLIACGYWVLLQKSVLGRELFAIGCSTDGARFAGINVNRKLTIAYVLCGLITSLVAVIYVAHLGQAKADAGSGYELMAITAVVLGGTSIFGGKGSILGTLLGLFAIAILQNGTRLADLPAELAGILTGILLLVTIGLDARRGLPRVEPLPDTGGFIVKNSQVAVLCAVILAAAGIVAGTIAYQVSRAVQISLNLQAQPGGPRASAPSRPLTVAMMPKSKGNAYFVACRAGAEEAAKELGITLLWDGPTDPDPAKQNEVIETWITRGVDVIAVAVENRVGISSVLRKAQSRGIKVITWDADAEPDARSFFVNQATPEGIGHTLMDNAARILGNKGDFAIITASLTAANMIEWQKQIELRRKEKYPDVRMAVLRPCDDKYDKAFDEANVIMRAHPSVRVIMAICSPAMPGSGEAVKQSGRKDVQVLGLGLPNDNKRYVHAGITDCVILWNTRDLGYLTVHAAKSIHEGGLLPGAKSTQAGRLGKLEIEGDNILLGKPFVFTKANIDQFDF